MKRLDAFLGKIERFLENGLFLMLEESWKYIQRKNYKRDKPLAYYQK